MDPRPLHAFLATERAGFVRAARLRLPTDADAEDVVQRAMLLAAEHAASLEDPSRVRSWFARILRRSVVDFYRARPPAAARDVKDTDAVTEPASPSHACACSLKLLADLRPAYAEVLRRVDLEGESPETVAVALGVSVPSLYVRLHRARHALRDRVKDHCGVATCGPCLDCTCDAHGRCGTA